VACIKNTTTWFLSQAPNTTRKNAKLHALLTLNANLSSLDTVLAMDVGSATTEQPQLGMAVNF
jgi:hypothetical protein